MNDNATPQEQLARVVALRKLADELERDAVAHALAQGWTWARIGAELGVSAQAAHKRLARIVATDKDKP